MLGESFVISGVSGLFCRFYFILIDNPVSKQYVASDLRLLCLPMTLIHVSR